MLKKNILSCRKGVHRYLHLLLLSSPLSPPCSLPSPPLLSFTRFTALALSLDPSLGRLLQPLDDVLNLVRFLLLEDHPALLIRSILREVGGSLHVLVADLKLIRRARRGKESEKRQEEREGDRGVAREGETQQQRDEGKAKGRKQEERGGGRRREIGREGERKVEDRGGTGQTGGGRKEGGCSVVTTLTTPDSRPHSSS